jgi:hypothetical protein
MSPTIRNRRPRAGAGTMRFGHGERRSAAHADNRLWMRNPISAVSAVFVTNAGRYTAIQAGESGSEVLLPAHAKGRFTLLPRKNRRGPGDRRPAFSSGQLHHSTIIKTRVIDRKKGGLPT